MSIRVIASVYGAVGHQWVPLTVLDDKERLEENSNDASTSIAPLLLPASTDRPQERNIYLELLWQEVQNMATASAGMSDMVIYQPPRWDRASAELNRLAHKAASRAQQVCSGYTINGVCQDMLLLDSGDKYVLSQPVVQGLFLSWNVVLRGMVATVNLSWENIRFYPWIESIITKMALHCYESRPRRAKAF